MGSKPETIEKNYLAGSLGQWFRAFWPVLLSVGIGGAFFPQAVVDSIESTQYPALIYIIFVIFGFTLLLVAYALWRFGREELLALRLRSLRGDERSGHLQGLGWQSDLASVYDTALQPDFSQGLLVLQQKIDTELYSSEEQLLSHLDLPTYLSNSLVGIGLVGTFVGLLSALGDFGQLLSGMQGTGGGDADPVAMFSGLMQRLQAPMEGMGTAFVSSLYGLLGSLIMGLVLQSARKSGNAALMRVRELLRVLGAQFAAEAEGAPGGSVAGLENMLNTIQEGQKELSEGLERFADAVSQQSCLLEVLSKGVKVETGQLRQMDEAMNQMREAGRQLAAEQRRARRPGGIWQPIGILLALLLLAGSLAASLMAVRNSGQLNRQLLLMMQESQAQLALNPNTVTPAVAGRTEPVAASWSDSVYVVIEGDTLAEIAQRHRVPLEAVLALNPEVADPDRLIIGQKVRVPWKPAASGTSRRDSRP